MIPTRFVPGQAPRKSRMEGNRQSFLPRRLGSTDRLSDARRPSGAGARSSSAEPARASVAVGRLSREASATQLPINRRSRSQQGDSRYGQPSTTPLRTNQYLRPTTTPVRTPSGDRSRSWEASLDRALACVTVKDQRPISNMGWQRAATARVQEALAARGQAAALIRPLTIARFVDVAGALLHAVAGDDNLNTDNYVTKLPHMCKRLLYPGAVSKSWLKAVNTLHAFPQALALIAYLLDLLQRIESPVSDTWLYVDSDDLSRLRREYLCKCFIRFQTPEPEYEDLTAEYLLQLKQLLGTDDDRIRELQEAIKQQEQALAEETESSQCARAAEAQRLARRDALTGALRTARRSIQHAHAELHAARARQRDQAAELKAVDADIARATAEQAQLRRELEGQAMSVEERGRLLDEVDYATRVHDSKRVLAEQVAKMVHSKETELALWQKKALDSCVEYKQGLIHLAAQFPDLASLAVDETKLMEPSCAAAASAALETLKQLAARLAQRRAQLARTRTALASQRQTKLEEARASISSLKRQLESIERSQAQEAAAEAEQAARAQQLAAAAAARLQEYAEKDQLFRSVHDEMMYWRKQDDAWRAKLSSMRQYIREQKEGLPGRLQAAYRARVELVADALHKWQIDVQL